MEGVDIEMAVLSRSTPRGIFSVERPRRRPPARACWLCGVVSVSALPDPHYRGGPLCRECWPWSPSAYDAATRGTSALRVVLGLRRVSPVDLLKVADVARRLGVRAWCDVPDAAPNRIPFGHINVETRVAAKDLLGLEQLMMPAGGRPR